MKTLVTKTVIVFLGIFTIAVSAFGQDVWTNARFAGRFIANRTITFTVNDGPDYIFEGDILIPPDGMAGGGDDYVIAFEPGVIIYFRENGNGDIGGSLTIRTRENGAVGRIKAEGEAGDLVTYASIEDNGGEGVPGEWDGIIITNDPGGDGNIIDYCEIIHAGDAINGRQHGILIDGSLNNAQAVVTNSEIHDNGDNAAGVYVEGPNADFLIQCNNIYESGTGIWLEPALEDPIDLDGIDAITNNIIHDNAGIGIYIHNAFRSNICNNIIYGNGNDGIFLWDNCECLVANNTIDGEDGEFADGISCNASWDNTLINNMIVNCNVGIIGFNVALCEVDDHFLDSSIDEDFVGCDDDDDDCIIDPAGGPSFVDAGNHDYHLTWESPAINAGDPAAAYDDPDGSDNDMGALDMRIISVSPPVTRIPCVPGFLRIHINYSAFLTNFKITMRYIV